MKLQLKRKRKLLGFTQYRLAQAAGIPPWKITFFESGRTKLTLDEVEKIKFALARRAEQVNAALAAA